MFYIVNLLIGALLVVYGFTQFKIQDLRIKQFMLFITLLCFIMAIVEFLLFDRSVPYYQEVFTLDIYTNQFKDMTSCAFGIDGVSILFVLLTTMLIPMCLLTAWNSHFKKTKDFFIYFLMLELLLVLTFVALDLILFFIFFESILIPMFFIIGVWGSRHRRVRASFLLFIYTLFGSIFFFFAILLILSDIGTTNLTVLSKIHCTIDKQYILWVLIYIGFSIKIPTIPFHTWLPEAHVEAPTAGSVMLAGLLLKLGGYGFIRILLPVCRDITIYYLPVVNTLALVSIIYASLTTIRQVDLKRIVAYSSIAHMNLVVLGIFAGNSQGIIGSIFLMVAHGVVSSALFFCIGVLYDKYKTRLLFYYGSLIQVMPIYSTLLLIFSLANTGIPGSVNFIGELTVFMGLVDSNFFVTMISISSVIFSVIYTMFFYNRLVFGNVKVNYIFFFKDVTRIEWYILFPLAFLSIFLGFHPNTITDVLIASVSLLSEKIKWI